MKIIRFSLRVAGLAFGFNLLLVAPVHPQTSTLTVNLGMARPLAHQVDESIRVFYPQVEYAQALFRKDDVAFRGSLYLGAWAGVQTQSLHAPTYRQSSLILGVRMSLDLEKSPLLFWTGVSKQFRYFKYIEGTKLTGEVGRNHIEGVNAVEAGARAILPLGNRIGLGCEGQVFLRMPTYDSPDSLGFSLGLIGAYTF